MNTTASAAAGIVLLLAVAASCSAGPRLTRPAYALSLCFVSADELRQSGEPTLYEAVRAVRPTLLRGNLHDEPPIVIVDGTVTADGIAALQALRVEETLMIRRLNAMDATQRYGLHRTNAVLEVVTSRPGKVALEESAYRC